MRTPLRVTALAAMLAATLAAVARHHRRPYPLPGLRPIPRLTWDDYFRDWG